LRATETFGTYIPVNNEIVNNELARQMKERPELKSTFPTGFSV